MTKRSRNIETVQDLHEAIVDHLGCDVADVIIDEAPGKPFNADGAGTMTILVDRQMFDEYYDLGVGGNELLVQDIRQVIPPSIGVNVEFFNGEAVPDPGETPDPDEVLRDNAEMYQEKNEDYGESWRLAGETLSMWARELDADLDIQDEHEAISIGLYFQRLHKLTRSFNLEFGHGDPNNEPISESHSDESTYGAIHTSHSLSDE